MQREQIIQRPGVTSTLGNRIYPIRKRIMDIALSTLILVLTAPLMLLFALWIKLDSPGPILFRQVRIGRGGRPFVMYKFRSMQHEADPEIHRRYVQSFIRNQLSLNRSASQTEGGLFKLVKDPRVTRAGRVLRKTSLDELPQIFNVLRGEMSLVGPRPPLPYEVQEYEEWHMERLAAMPGLTGWWQVYGRSRVPFDEMVRMDLNYMAQRSLWLDLKILCLTIPAVVRGTGAK